MSLFDYLCLALLAYVCVWALMFRRQAVHARRRAADREQRFEQLFEEVPLACQETDRRGRIYRVNQKLCDLRGLRASEILGRHYADFAAENERDKTRQELDRKLAGEAPLVARKQSFVRRDGSTVMVEVHETLLRDAAGEVIGLRSAALDVTEHIRKEEEIWQTTGELRAIFQALPDVFLRID